MRHASDLADSLFNYGVCLHEYETADEPSGSRIRQACTVQAEAIGIRRLLNARDDRFRGQLALALHNYGISLGEAGRILDACKVEEEAVAIRREMYESEPSSLKYKAALAQSLYNYGLSLAEADSQGLLDCIHESCTVLKECVWLRRQQANAWSVISANMSPDSPRVISTHGYGDRWGLDLAMALNASGWALHCAERYEEACTVKEEAVAAFRVSPAHRRADLASALHNLGSSLYQVGRINEACDAYGEASKIRRRDYELDPALYRNDYEASIHDLSFCLKQLDLKRPDSNQTV